jgi:molybdopterin-guanine dinucleotide biosynthesis protein A
MTERQRRSVSFEIAILAGGLSRRLGRDKARLRLGRRTLVGHIRATALSLGLRARVIRRDLVPRCGPLGGVYTALIQSQSDPVLFLSCDMPFVSAPLLLRLIDHLKPGTKAVFVTTDEGPGFPFLLRRQAMAAVERQLAQRKHLSLQQLARNLNATLLRVPRLRADELLNINTRSDWQRARRLWVAAKESR